MPIRRQAIIWTNDDPIHWCIYASLGGDELTTETCMFSLHLQMSSGHLSRMRKKTFHMWGRWNATCWMHEGRLEMSLFAKVCERQPHIILWLFKEHRADVWPLFFQMSSRHVSHVREMKCYWFAARGSGWPSTPPCLAATVRATWSAPLLTLYWMEVSGNSQSDIQIQIFYWCDHVKHGFDQQQTQKDIIRQNHPFLNRACHPGGLYWG